MTTALDGFRQRRIATGEVEIAAWVGGSGPPLLCLHGFPQTHLTWRRVAPRLAERFTVVLIDARGSGESEKPPPDDEHRTYAKRTLARDAAAVMDALGFPIFAVAGHDRGARVAYRLALDRPERVRALASLDVIPTLDVWDAMDADGAYRAYHWPFLAQPAPFPETLIGADPDFFIDWTIRSWLRDPAAIDEATMRAYREAFRSPGAIAAACADYRAGYTRDREDDAEDRARGRRIACPVLVLWGAGPVSGAAADLVSAWRAWADDVRGFALPHGHFLMEEAPDAVAGALLAFFDA